MTGNHEYQRDLAARLVAADGAEAALEFARENGWDGLVQRIEALIRSRSDRRPGGSGDDPS